MLNAFTKFLQNWKRNNIKSWATNRGLILDNAYMQSLIDNLRARYWNLGPGNERGARTTEQFPHLGNYTLTPDHFRTNIKQGGKTDIYINYLEQG